MKLDFDYVTIDDYASDMNEASQRASCIIDAQRREIRDLKAMFAAAVMAAGGTISIGRGHLIDLDHIVLRNWFDESRGAYVFTAKWKEAE